VQIAASTQEVLIRIPDPVGVAAAWRQYGFHNLHVIDLDRAARRGDNDFQIESILGSTDAEVDVGGGVRTRDLIEKLLDGGAQRVVVGSRALEDPAWLEEMSMSFPGRVLVAIDVRNRRVLSHGWTRGYSKLVLDLVEELNGLSLGGLLVTTVRAPLALDRPDFPLVEDMVESAEFPIFVGGDVASVSDLRTLADRGVAAVVLGLALYGGAMDPRAIAEEFSA
jgi:phosphoribosylformimino-5-aminoimidazole carboxamide ribotide isomerase